MSEMPGLCIWLAVLFTQRCSYYVFGNIVWIEFWSCVIVVIWFMELLLHFIMDNGISTH